MRTSLVVVGLVCASFGACSKQSSTPPSSPEPTTEEPGEPGLPGAAPDDGERAKLTSAECEAQGGVVVGDIGDGAIHRPDYTCESGSPPIGTIAPDEGGPVAIEGAVCCQ